MILTDVKVGCIVKIATGAEFKIVEVRNSQEHRYVYFGTCITIRDNWTIDEACSWTAKGRYLGNGSIHSCDITRVYPKEKYPEYYL